MAGIRELGSNVCPVEFGVDALEVWARDVAEAEDLGALREAHASKWSVQWERGQVYFLPLTGDLQAPAGTTAGEA